MAEQLAAVNAAFEKLKGQGPQTGPQVDYYSFLAGWNACLAFNQEKGS